MTRINCGIPAQLTSMHTENREVTAAELYSDGIHILRFQDYVGNISELRNNDLILINGKVWGKHPYPSSIEKICFYSVAKIIDGYILVEDANRVRAWIPNKKPSIQIGDFIKYDFISKDITVIENSTANDFFSLDIAPFLYKPKDTLHYENFYGYSSLVSRIKRFFDINLRKKDLLKKYNSHPAKGILFAGNPGTGKTFLGKIIASEFKLPFYLISGPSIISKWVGDSENTLHNIFRAASQSVDGAIIFIDEIDAIAPARTSLSSQHDTRLVEQLLTEMDGFNSDNNIMVIASTNRIDSIDPALKRPGRFDRIEVFPPPTLNDRLEILTSKESTIPHEKLPIKEIVKRTEGFSSAELCAIFTEAIQLAVYHEREKISELDFIQGFNIVEKTRKKDGREYTS